LIRFWQETPKRKTKTRKGASLGKKNGFCLKLDPSTFVEHAARFSTTPAGPKSKIH